MFIYLMFASCILRIIDFFSLEYLDWVEIWINEDGG